MCRLTLAGNLLREDDVQQLRPSPISQVTTGCITSHSAHTLRGWPPLMGALAHQRPRAPSLSCASQSQQPIEHGWVALVSYAERMKGRDAGFQRLHGLGVKPALQVELREASQRAQRLDAGCCGRAGARQR